MTEKKETRRTGIGPVRASAPDKSAVPEAMRNPESADEVCKKSARSFMDEGDEVERPYMNFCSAFRFGIECARRETEIHLVQ
jgi:hypothetical protein